MGKEKHKKKKTQGKTQTKRQSQHPSDQWGPVLGKTFRSFASGWVQNLIIGLILLLIGPAIGALMKSPKVIIAAAAAGITLLVWVVALIMMRQFGKSQATPESGQSETHGELLPAKDPTPPNPCGKIPSDAIALFLGNSAVFGNTFPHTVLMVRNENVLSIGKSGPGMTVSAKVFSRDGRIVAQTIDNEFFINPNNFFRRERPDKSTLVVYDQEDRQVLRVRYLNSSAIRILGIFNFPGISPVIIDEDQLVLSGRVVSHFCFGNNRVDFVIR
jgi:hypothetical protein